MIRAASGDETLSRAALMPLYTQQRKHFGLLLLMLAHDETLSIPSICSASRAVKPACAGAARVTMAAATAAATSGG